LATCGARTLCAPRTQPWCRRGRYRLGAQEGERLSEMPVNAGGPEAHPPEPPAAPVSGVRTEHQLRLQLKDAMERNTRFERALRESVAFAYGRRAAAALARLQPGP